MIATTLILGAGLLIGIGLVVKFWNNIISYMKKAIPKVQEAIRIAVDGCRVGLRKTTDAIQQVTRFFSQNRETKVWTETIARRTLEENEIPEEHRERLILEGEFDVSDELEMKLRSA